ncbi:MAG: RNA polymerase sigma factor [Solirubrobacteraceae bacterium]
MSSFGSQPDAALLRTDSPEAFGVFYRRHLPWVLGWLLRHVRERELAADLAGEVFASALRRRESFDAAQVSAEPWLQTIARNVLIDSVRRGRVEDRVRRELGIEPLAMTDTDLAEVDNLIDEARGATPATVAFGGLPPEQSAAIRARVLDEEEYADIAARLKCSTAVVRQRVSRGLRAMRATLEEPS